MDDQRFDLMTQRVTRALTRRRFGGALAALGLGAGFGAGSQAKKKRPKKPACSKKQKRKCRRQARVCEDGKCVVVCDARNSVCRGNQIIQLCGGGQAFCDCSPLAQGGFACAAARPETCPGASECSRNAQCPSGEVCVDVSGDDCCGGQEFGVCLRECKAGSPGV